MNFIKPTVFTLLLSTCVMSCETTSETESKQLKEETNQNDVMTEEPEEFVVDYNSEWAVFQTAMRNKDTSAIQSFYGNNDIDTDMLMMVLDDSVFIDALNQTEYESLSETEKEGEILKQFSNLQSYSSEDGDEFESGIYFYFAETDSSLQLHSFFIAG